ncbi:MAG: hypothetical protein LBP92_11300 [Deltaproteobacteria bacterium]|jgi:hypothetical protein|nr:hypothetical protein [Deltaproteobacteria bacterium]
MTISDEMEALLRPILAGYLEPQIIQAKVELRDCPGLGAATKRIATLSLDMCRLVVSTYVKGDE